MRKLSLAALVLSLAHVSFGDDSECSSHNAMWEKNRPLLFRASLEWLTQGSVNVTKDGMLRLGY